ncbi:hypothetical protein [Nesterenkonia populi]|uniref:hypothetical protein n=1 Tax=Nesterenkonia populi TaxID=1591087 RepID=UPI0011BF6E39|nr:hypothetical protein [Nesterenkonia populi]
MTDGARLVTDFESSINAVRAVSGFLEGEGHAAMGTGPSSEGLAGVAASLPEGARAKAFEWAGRAEALSPTKLGDIRADTIDQWVVDQYSKDDAEGRPQQFPVIVVGAVSGAAFFLSAALGAPYLPQTTLVSLADGDTHPDDIAGAMEAWAPAARQIAAQNPRVTVHHMHDPAQDRPMMQQAAFFRLKRQELGPVYEQFIRTHLAPDGVLLTLESTRTWRATETGQRSYFQFGCLGGLPEEEYTAGSERVAEFLADQGSERRSWSPPEPTTRTPDGEWGTAPALTEDVDRFAQQAGLRRRRLYTNEPQDSSAFVAELYRDWYDRLGDGGHRMLAQMYTHVDPYWTLATRSVPFWNRFHKQPSFDVFSEYLETAEPYREIFVSLFAHGVRSPALVSPEEWERLAAEHVQERAEVIGVDWDAYPMDTGAPFRYQEAMKKIAEHRDIPDPLSIEEVDAFAEQYGILTEGPSLPEHHDDVEGHGIRNPIAWVQA